MNARWALFLALCVSVAVNGVLLSRGPAVVALPVVPSVDAATPPKLETAMKFVWPPVVSVSAPGDLGVAKAVPSGPVDATLQQDVLCTVAEEKLRQGWRNDRDAIAESLKRSLTDNAEQTKNVNETATHIADVIGLSADQRAAFLDRYREQRATRITEAYAALAKQDFQGLYTAARSLYADEDTLALELAGETGRERLRVADLEGRTTILAIAAAMADAPFESLSW